GGGGCRPAGATGAALAGYGVAVPYVGATPWATGGGAGTLAAAATGGGAARAARSASTCCCRAPTRSPNDWWLARLALAISSRTSSRRLSISSSRVSSSWRRTVAVSGRSATERPINVTATRASTAPTRSAAPPPLPTSSSSTANGARPTPDQKSALSCRPPRQTLSESASGMAIEVTESCAGWEWVRYSPVRSSAAAPAVVIPRVGAPRSTPCRQGGGPRVGAARRPGVPTAGRARVPSGRRLRPGRGGGIPATTVAGRLPFLIVWGTTERLHQAGDHQPTGERHGRGRQQRDLPPLDRLQAVEQHQAGGGEHGAEHPAPAAERAGTTGQRRPEPDHRPRQPGQSGGGLDRLPRADRGLVAGDQQHPGDGRERHREHHGAAGHDRRRRAAPLGRVTDRAEPAHRPAQAPQRTQQPAEDSHRHDQGEQERRLSGRVVGAGQLDPVRLHPQPHHDRGRRAQARRPG